jgi:hypothetical protein
MHHDPVIDDKPRPRVADGAKSVLVENFYALQI